MTQPLFFRDDAGKVFEVPKDQIETANRAGLVPASQSDVDAALKRAEANSAAGHAKTFAEGFASGTVDAATAIPRAASAIASHVTGQADPLEEMTGRGALETVASVAGGGAGTLQGARAARDYAEAARLRATENPGTAMAGSIGGQVLGAEIGGLGALARGIGGGAAALAGGGRLARTAGAVISGAAEGAPLNLTAAQDQAYIEQRKLTGSMAMAALGTGALIGGGIGGLTHGLGEVIGATKDAVVNRFMKPATGEDAVRVAEQQFGEAAPGLRDAYSKASGAVSGKNPETIRNLIAGGEEGAAARRIAVFEGDSIREAAKRDVVKHVDDMANATRNLTEEWRGPVKPANVEKVIAKGEDAFVAQSNQAIDQLHNVRSWISQATSEPAALNYGERAAIRKLDDFARAAETKAAKAIESGNGTELFSVLDQYKRNVGSIAKVNDRAMSAELQGIHEGLRQALENETVWGGAGAMQRDVNAPFSRWLKSKEIFDQRFMSKIGEADPLNPWRSAMGTDPGKVDSYVEGLTSAKNDLNHQIIKRHIENTKDLAASLSKAGELTPEKAVELHKIVQAAEGFEKTIGQAEKSLVLTNQLRELEKMSGHGMGEFAGAALGGMVGGPVGAAIGAIGAGLRNPGLMVRRMAMMERMAAKAGMSVDGSLDKLFAGIEQAGAKVKQAGAVAGKSVTPSALEIFQGKHATPELAYKERAKEILAADANYGQRIRDNAAKVFGGAFDSDPHAIGAAVIATTKAVRLLAEKMPGGLVDHQSLTPLSAKTAPSSVDIQEYAQIYAAVTQPLTVLADVAKGSVTRDQIDAIAQTNPPLIQHFREKTLERLRKLDERGVEVPIRQRLILDSLLDLDGAGEPAFSTSFAVKYQQGMSDMAAAAGAQKPPPPSNRKSQVGARLRTQTDSMLGGEE